jgi:hypothetical protein
LTICPHFVAALAQQLFAEDQVAAFHIAFEVPRHAVAIEEPCQVDGLDGDRDCCLDALFGDVAVKAAPVVLVRNRIKGNLFAVPLEQRLIDDGNPLASGRKAAGRYRGKVRRRFKSDHPEPLLEVMLSVVPPM